jgi:hypothetical protein
MAVGQIQSDGTYELTTYKPADGAVVGKHFVVVMPPVEGNDEPPSESASPVAATVIPAKYGLTATSGLVCEVMSGEHNEFPISMQSK